jgi:hypothetical protein
MAVPARAIAERRIAEYFLQHDAVRPDSAIEFNPSRAVRARAFARMKGGRVILQVLGNRWYLDAPAWISRREERRKRAVAIAAAGMAIGILAAIL